MHKQPPRKDSDTPGRQSPLQRPKKGSENSPTDQRRKEMRFVGARLLDLLFAPIANLPVIIPAMLAAWLLGKALERIWSASVWHLVVESISLIICLRLFWLLLRFVRRRIYAMTGIKKYLSAAGYALYIAACYAAPGWLAGASLLPEDKGGRIAGALCTSVVGFIFYSRNMGLSSPLLRLLRRLLRLPPSESD